MNLRLKGRRGIAIIAAGCALLAVGLTLAAIGVRRSPVETDLSARAEGALQAAGIYGVAVGFDGRDAHLSGPVTSRVAEQAIVIVNHLRGVRTVTARFVAPPALPVATSPSSPSTTTAAPSTTVGPGADFELASEGDVIRLMGVVPTAEASAAIITSAIDTFGNDRVRNDLAIDPGVTNAEWLDAIPTSIAAMAMTSRPGLVVADPIITVSGTVTSDVARLVILAAVATTGLELHDRLTVEPRLTSEGAAQIEASLNSILGEGTALFATGSAEITPAGAALVAAAAEILRTVESADVEVGGHTDSTGDPDENLVLSRARAEAVVARLVAAGVDGAILTPVGYGDTQPIVTNFTEAGRAANRRIEFTVEGSPS